MTTIKEIAQECWQNAEDHGFHAAGVNSYPSAWVANLHGEVSEFWEAYRKNQLDKQCNKTIELTNAEEELADIIIRAFDVAGQMDIDIEKAILIKHEYNKTRPYLHGGKKA